MNSSTSSMDKAADKWNEHAVPVSVSHGKGEMALATVEGMDPATAEMAARAREAENSLGLWQAFKAYRWAVFWSILVSMNIVMESYDTILLSSFYGYDSFNEKFGERLPSGKYSLPAEWQSAISLAASVGIIIGILLNGLIIDRYGHKVIMMWSLVALCGTIGLIFGATSRSMLLAGQLLSGIPWGTLNVIAPAYAIEVAPTVLRHYGPTFVNLCWVIGHIIAVGVLVGLQSNTTEWGWKIPFALQWAFPIPLLIGAWLCPPSPWWLVRRGRKEEAVQAMRRLADDTVNHVEVVALIEHTVKLEEMLQFGSSYASCFRGVDRRRTEIAIVAWCAQVLVGFSISGYQAYFFRLAGMAQADSFKLTLGTYCVAFVGTSSAMALQQRFGRRPLWFMGLLSMFASMIIIGILACLPQTQTILWAEGAMVLVWFFNYGWSLGPLPYVICCEIGSAQLRQKTIAIARASYYVLSIVNTVATPYILNEGKANFKGKAAFLPAGFIVLLAVWSFFRLPETKGRGFDELDVMFADKVPARKFKAYVVNESEASDGKP
ncbi:hypothetical protein CspHIS471_0108190 [Cutaneotrichosporon sp. HIS471]|nr:hypothetical protein CspHIS471_0108190 [Cutaneotrichosporon sp. HIS471]